MMKKVFYISVGLLILTLIFIGAYNFAFKHNVNDPVADKEKKEVAVKEEGVTEIAPVLTAIESPINEQLQSVALGGGGTVYYYSLDEQALKKASFEGKDKVTLLSDLPGTPSRILWSPQKDQAFLLLQVSGGKTLWHLADLSTKTLAPLKPEISRLTWNNLGDKVFYQYTDPKTGLRTLNVSNPNGTGWKKLADLGNQDFFLAPIPQSTAISFWTRPNALEKTTFESVSLSGENRRVLLSEKYGADYLWSPSGERVLVSANKEMGGSSVLLNLMNQNGGEFQTLSIPTFISKAVWSKDGQTIYYALPGALPESAVLPNDYFDKPLYTKDTFWKMDILTGKKSRLVDLTEVTQSFDSIDLFLSSFEDILFFTDRATKRLYRIDL